MTKVFVYGTLLSGYGNHRWYLQDQECLGPARTKPEFTLINVGGFPGLLEGGNTAIIGEVYNVDDQCLKGLDCLEGCDPDNTYRGMYGRLQITLEDGREVMTYRFNTNTPERYHKIESGSYREFDSGHKHSYCG